MANCHITIPDALFARADRVIAFAGLQTRKAFILQAMGHEVDRHWPMMLAEERRARKTAQEESPRKEWVKLPDSLEARNGKAAHRELVGWLSGQRASMKEHYVNHFGRFEEKVEAARREHNWAKLIEWNEKQVWSLKARNTPEDKAYLEKALA